MYNKYMHLVYGLCLKYLKNREESQDAVMAIYEHISKKLLTAEVKHFKSWLYMVSKNHCLMELRKNNPEMHTDFFMESPDAVHLKEDKEALEEDLQSLEVCIEELKVDQKQCVKLFFLEKKSYHQVKDQTGIDLKKVKSHIQNGKRNLKMCLERKHVNR
ncbi:MAG: sigma-70 family RNA polymerase sigma factor [Bacteroidota bacterium]